MLCAQFLILETDLLSKTEELNQAAVEMKELRQSLESLRDEKKALKADFTSELICSREEDHRDLEKIYGWALEEEKELAAQKEAENSRIAADLASLTPG